MPPHAPTAAAPAPLTAAAPKIGLTPYQSTLSGSARFAREALEAVKGVLRALESSRVGRRHRAPTAAEMAQAAGRHPSPPGLRAAAPASASAAASAAAGAGEAAAIADGALFAAEPHPQSHQRHPQLHSHPHGPRHPPAHLRAAWQAQRTAAAFAAAQASAAASAAADAAAAAAHGVAAAGPHHHRSPHEPPQLHRNLWGVLTHIWVREGPRALIRGMFPRMMLHGPASAATFVCYEQVLRLSRREPGAGPGDGDGDAGQAGAGGRGMHGTAGGLGSTHAAAASPRS